MELVLFQVVGDALGDLALLEPMRPGFAAVLAGGFERIPGERDQVDSLVDLGAARFIGLWRRRRLFCLRRLRRDTGSTIALELVEFALGFVGLPAEADGAAAEAEDLCQRHVRVGGLAESLERMEAEADDFGGEAEFVRRFDFVGREHLARGVACDRQVPDGAG
jgi:hypothetical protein